MLTINPGQMTAFGARARAALAMALAADRPQLGDGPQFARYIDEAMAAGIEVEQDVWRAALLLAQADRAGRPAGIAVLLADPDVAGPLKVYQIAHALAEG
jgi:hypothetical protein